MSFSKDVKEELVNQIPKSRHCRIAEMAGLLNFGARIQYKEGKSQVFLSIADEQVLRKYFTLANKTLNINLDIAEYKSETIEEIRKSIKLSEDMQMVDQLILQQPCCKRAYIRGAFLASGSISDPNKGYHFEIVCTSNEQAELLMLTINSFEVEAKIVKRSGRFVVYIKEGAQIVEILRVMEASHSVMDLENIRVVKEVRGSINRKVNCETANISKTVNAAVRQIEDIRFLEEEIGLDNLPETLQQVAQLRLANPDTSLQDLGKMLCPPLGKSGVNHRLKKISLLADNYRDN